MVNCIWPLTELSKRPNEYMWLVFCAGFWLNFAVLWKLFRLKPKMPLEDEGPIDWMPDWKQMDWSTISEITRYGHNSTRLFLILLLWLLGMIRMVIGSAQRKSKGHSFLLRMLEIKVYIHLRLIKKREIKRIYFYHLRRVHIDFAPSYILNYSW